MDILKMIRLNHAKYTRHSSSKTSSRSRSSYYLTSLISLLPSMNFIIVLLISIQILNCIAEPITDSTTEYNLISKSDSGPSSSKKGLTIQSTKNNSPSTQASTKINKRAGSLAEPKSKKIPSSSNNGNSKEIQKPQNRSREALSHEGSERETVVYLSDSSGYVPVTSYRSPRPPLSSHHSTTGTGSGSGSISSPSGNGGSNSANYHAGPSSIELENWRPDPWDRDYTKRTKFNNTRVQHIEAECQDDYMKIRIGFNGSFTGLLYSAGYAYDPDCMYINGSGRDYYEFYIQLNRCGTLGKNALHDDNRKNPTNFMWNTITVQYNPLIEEEFDEHFKVTCEYGYDFWKTVTFPFLDVEVATGNPVVFTLSPPECYMEIRNGYGISGTRVTGPVRVGDPLTLIIYMRSKYDGFDIVVNDCYAHNGAQKRIQLIDEYGCPVDDKLISRFRGTWSDSGVYETQVYAYMKTFRFTGSPALYIECDVRMCHGRCPSQPCHWRNLKTVSKREISNQTFNTAIETTPPPAATTIIDDKETTQSENINLFQSLRVLQEGEEDEDNFNSQLNNYQLNHETCIRTTILSALSAAFSLLLCILSASLIIACSKLRYRKKERKPYNTYFNHKSQQN